MGLIEDARKRLAKRARAESNGKPERETPAGLTAAEIIRLDFQERFAPVFKRNGALWSNTEARLVRRSEALAGAPTSLIQQLRSASNAPKLQNGEVNEGQLPRLYATWGPTAYVDLLADLKEEAETAEQDGEVSQRAVESFHDRVRAALLTIVAMGRTRDSGETEIERRTLIDWCKLWAKAGPWQAVRSYQLWTRLGDEGLEAALRFDLFGQLPGCSDLAALGRTKFARLATQYGIGNPKAKVQEQRCVVLSGEFLDELLATPNSPDGHLDTSHSRPRTHAREEVSKCPADTKTLENPANEPDTLPDTLPDTSGKCPWDSIVDEGYSGHFDGHFP